jgi:hypothetical protein
MRLGEETAGARQVDLRTQVPNRTHKMLIATIPRPFLRRGGAGPSGGLELG